MLMAYTLLATAPSPKQVEPELAATAIRIREIDIVDAQLEVRSQGPPSHQKQRVYSSQKSLDELIGYHRCT